MAETPDFESIARGLIAGLPIPQGAEVAVHGCAVAEVVASIVKQLREVWNARGAADLKAVEDRLATLTGWITSEPYRQHLAEAIKEQDR